MTDFNGLAGDNPAALLLFSMVSLQEVCRAYGKHEKTIMALVNDGFISARKMGRIWALSLPDVIDYAEANGWGQMDRSQWMEDGFEITIRCR